MKINIVATNPRRKPIPYSRQSTDANSLGTPHLLERGESIDGHVLTVNTDRRWFVLNDAYYRYVFDIDAQLDIKIARFRSKVSPKTKNDE